jgi:hypothetical protein
LGVSDPIDKIEDIVILGALLVFALGVGVAVFEGVKGFQGLFGKSTASAPSPVGPSGSIPAGGISSAISNAVGSVVKYDKNDPVNAAIFSSGSDTDKNWIPKWLGGDGGDFNDGQGQMDRIWNWLFGSSDSGGSPNPIAAPIPAGNPISFSAPMTDDSAVGQFINQNGD